MNGNAFSHIVASVVLVNTSLTVRTSVAMESQPAEFVIVTSYVPAASNVSPFHVYGSWLVQMLILVVDVNTSLTVNTRLAIESHPAELVNVTSYVPAASNV